MANISQGQLRAMINQIVEQAVGEKMGARAASWQSDYRADRARLSYDNKPRNRDSSGFDFYGAGKAISGIGNILEQQQKYRAIVNAEQEYRNKYFSDDGFVWNSKSESSSIQESLEKYKNRNKISGLQKFQSFGQALQGFGGLQNAYQNKDMLGGAQSGYSMATGIAGMFTSNPTALANWGWLGMGLGLLTGLFGKKKEINEWNKPKFKDAEQAYNKLFTVDRGERDLYHMPESFYFRNGWSGSRHIVVKVGNEQFNDHIRESMTSSYSNQLQRGLVF